MILNQSFFFSDWKPQVWQHQFLLLKTTIWSETASSHQHQGAHYSQQGLFFFMCLNSQRQCKKSMYKPNPDTRIMLACAIHGQMHRHLRDCAPSPHRLEVGKCQKDAWVQLSMVVSEMQPLTSIMLAEQSHLSRNTWKSKRRATLLVLQCRPHSYHRRRWGNLASTACLLSAPHSDLLATTSLTLQTEKVIMLAELKQSWSCVAIEHEELAIETEAEGWGGDTVTKKPPEGKAEGM